MGFFSRFKDMVVEAAYKVVDTISDYVSRDNEPRQAMGSVYMRDMAARAERVNASGNMVRLEQNINGSMHEEFERRLYNNVIELDLERMTRERPSWYKRPSGVYKRTGTDGY